MLGLAIHKSKLHTHRREGSPGLGGGDDDELGLSHHAVEAHRGGVGEIVVFSAHHFARQHEGIAEILPLLA